MNLIPNKEQNVCEKKLSKVMKRLNIEDFDFNWDRSSCYIEFKFQEQAYKLEHSIEKARKRGILLKNGMDCLIALTQSLEDLCVIIDRGTYDFETWISGMKVMPADQNVPEYEEELQLEYESLGEQDYIDYDKDEQFIPFTSRKMDRNRVIQRTYSK
nr:hypothetical protein [Thalassobacillus pellis]